MDTQVQASKDPDFYPSCDTGTPPSEQDPSILLPGSTCGLSSTRTLGQPSVTPEMLASLSFDSREREREPALLSPSENHLGPSFNVETSTTDSGVSNISSLASDCAGHMGGSEVRGTSSSPTDLESAFKSMSTSEGQSDCLEAVESSCGTASGCTSGLNDTNSGTDIGESCVENLSAFSQELSEATGSELDAGGSPSEEGSSRCSSVMDFLEPWPSSSSPSPLPPSLPPKEDGEEPDSSVITQKQESQRHSVSPRPGDSIRLSLRSIFKRKKLSYVGSADPVSQSILAATSTTGLILQNRPSNLPAKPPSEEKKHQKMHQEIVAAARRRELQRAKGEVERERQRRLKDKVVADYLRDWSRILPNWEALHKTRKVRELWWQGLPPGVRGQVWKKAIGNDLNISPELYQISLARCKAKLDSMQERSRSDSTASQKSLSREHSVEVIHLDVLRTFPTLGFFQEGGPYNTTLHDVLGAYACYRPDIGYVQGMSFLAAVLLLNMEAADAFICLANLLNRPSYLAFFKVDHSLMRPYFNTFQVLLQDTLPRVSAHFRQLEFSPEYYLIEWIFTIYTRVLPLDIACRVWDMFCRDGDSFLFRTAIGILRLYQSKLLEFQAIEDVGQFLGKLPSDLDSDTLFKNIAAVSISSKRFSQVLQQHLVTTSR